MRVISGTRKSLILKTISGTNTRPTTDRIKETLFNIISPYIFDCNFLDLFAGSGAIGIEALSRGARFCSFVEKNPKAVVVIRENLIKSDFTESSYVLCGNALKIDKILGDNIKYDIVYIDPPYNHGYEKILIKKILKTNIIKADTIYIVESSLETDFSWIRDEGLVLVRDKKYRTNKHIFLKRL